MIALRFIADHSLLSKAIRVRTDGNPSHVEYVDTITKMTFGARLQGGVRFRPLNYCIPTWEEFYVYPGIEDSYAQALSFAGRKYDWKDIAALAVSWHPSYYDPERAICSCLVGYSDRLRWAKGSPWAPLLNPSLPTWEMTPQIVYAVGALEQVEVAH